ncbi:MAG: 4Fe-4S binding protein [Methanobacterium sp.]|nr:4Fe-4S binding protein [Methanobacterium sp.]
MVNEKCGCQITNDNPDKKIKNKPKINEIYGFGEDSQDIGELLNNNLYNECGCGLDHVIDNSYNSNDGCGCGTIDFPDLSHIKNPDKPKFLADKDFINELENYVHSLDIINIGYTLLTNDLLIKDKFIQYPYTIVLTMEMDNNIIQTPPGEDAKDLNDTAYVKLAILTTKISDYLRKNGFATEIAHPYSGIVGFTSLAQKAVLGYIGKSGLLISPELGPRQKISAIFTSIANLPINETNPHSWIIDYCEKCGKCIKACPEKALITNITCFEHEETEFIKTLCIGCSDGCTYCIEKCPFNQKEYTHIKNRFEKINEKLTKNR